MNEGGFETLPYDCDDGPVTVGAGLKPLVSTIVKLFFDIVFKV